MAGEVNRSITSKSHSSVVKQLAREPYTCERLTQIRGGYRPLTRSCVALYFDFCNPEVCTNCRQPDSAEICSVNGCSRSSLTSSPILYSQHARMRQWTRSHSDTWGEYLGMGPSIPGKNAQKFPLTMKFYISVLSWQQQSLNKFYYMYISCNPSRFLSPRVIYSYRSHQEGPQMPQQHGLISTWTATPPSPLHPRGTALGSKLSSQYR